MTEARRSPAALARPAVAIAAGLLAAAVATWAAAEVVNTATPEVLVVGQPAGPARSDRLDAQRRGRADQPLPRRPRELWRHMLLGGLDFMPLVASDGSVVAVLSSRHAARIDEQGKERWRTPVGGGGAALPPVLTSDGAIAVVSTDGRMRRVGPNGALRVGPRLALRTRKAAASPLALDDGGVVLAGERQLLRVGGDGAPVARAELPEPPVGGLIGWGAQVVVTLPSGEVLTWRPPTPPRSLGRFGGSPVGGAVLLGGRSLVAVVDSSAVVALDLRSGRTKLLAGGPGSTRQFEGPPAAAASGLLLVTTVVGELLAIDAGGSLVRRVALENAMLIYGADGGAPLPSMFRRLELQPSPPLIVDPVGTIGFVRASGRLGVVAPTGLAEAVQVVTARFCGRPLGVLPAGSGRLLVACRNGALGMFGEDGS